MSSCIFMCYLSILIDYILVIFFYIIEHYVIGHKLIRELICAISTGFIIPFRSIVEWNRYIVCCKVICQLKLKRVGVGELIFFSNRSDVSCSIVSSDTSDFVISTDFTPIVLISVVWPVYVPAGMTSLV